MRPRVSANERYLLGGALAWIVPRTLLCGARACGARAQSNTMSPLLFFLTLGAADVDWLVATPRATSSVTKQCWPEYATPTSGTPCGLELANGLTSRRFIMSLDGEPMPFGTIDWLINATVEHGGLRSMYRAVTSEAQVRICLLYTSPSPRDRQKSRMPSSA